MTSQRRNPAPLTPARLEEMATAYVARFATTQAKLAAYLRRKLRERGWEGDGTADIDALVRRYAGLGYVDDAAWARMKAGSLLRRGYGARRVGEALDHAGIADDLRGEVRPDLAAQRLAALVMARKRRFGPFADRSDDGPPDRKARDRQLAAMLRAGHPLDIARRIVDASDPDMIREWADSAAGED